MTSFHPTISVNISVSKLMTYVFSALTIELLVTVRPEMYHIFMLLNIIIVCIHCITLHGTFDIMIDRDIII